MKYDILVEQEKKVSESSIHGIRKLAKDYPVANIYFHMDLDGVTSGIAMREYLKEHGIRTIDATPIQYGQEEYAVRKSREGVLNVLVDFSHGKTWMDIHLDHHDEQVGVSEGTKVNFGKARSNASIIQSTVSKRDIFPAQDIEIISRVDSADFARHGISPDDVISAIFKADEAKDVSQNRQMMGLACNKLLLAYKNKEDFMKRIVMEAKPSLHSIYTLILKMVNESGFGKPGPLFDKPERIERFSNNYLEHRKWGMLGEEVPATHIDRLAKDGGSAIVAESKMIVQKGGGKCWGGNQYDRYTIFKLYPDAHYLMTIWESLGMIQMSKNPFQTAENPHHLGNIAQSVLKRFEPQLREEIITLDALKRNYETLIKKKDIKGAVGFTWDDFEALFEGQIAGIQSSNDWWPNMVKDITNKPYSWLSSKQRNVLSKVSVNAWDVIQASSGGHRDITNISGIGFLRERRSFIYYEFGSALAEEMKDKRLIQV